MRFAIVIYASNQKSRYWTLVKDLSFIFSCFCRAVTERYVDAAGWLDTAILR